MKQKGSMRDIFLIVIIGFGLVLASLFAIKIMNVINMKMQASSHISTEAKAVLTTVNTRLPKWVDGAFLMFWVLMMILGMFLALQIQTNPVFLPISVIFFFFLVLVSRFFGSIYTQMVSSTVLSTQAGLLSIIPYVMPKLHIFSFLFGVIIIGLMVVKR